MEILEAVQDNKALIPEEGVEQQGGEVLHQVRVEDLHQVRVDFLSKAPKKGNKIGHRSLSNSPLELSHLTKEVL